MRIILIVQNYVGIPCLPLLAFALLCPASAQAVSETAGPAYHPSHTLEMGGVPSRMIIPSIRLDDQIESVGTSKNDQMAVPDGASNRVGWYRFGIVPGQIGTAVFDAHVFAAFSHLNKVLAGDDIFIATDQHQKLHFVVNSVKTYSLKDLRSDMLFSPSATPDINLITCAGKLTRDHKTYDHRLVVNATLIRDL